MIGSVQVRQLVETLRCCAHEAFPVTPDVKRAFETAEAFDLQGIILRDAVLKLLQHRFGFLHADLSGELPSAKSHIPTTQKVRVFISIWAQQWTVCGPDAFQRQNAEPAAK